MSAEPLPDRVEELLGLERRLEQEWWWINGALHAVAQLQAEGPRTIRALSANWHQAPALNAPGQPL
jgi:hypothetical protein